RLDDRHLATCGVVRHGMAVAPVPLAVSAGPAGGVDGDGAIAACGTGVVDCAVDGPGDAHRPAAGTLALAGGGALAGAAVGGCVDAVVGAEEGADAVDADAWSADLDGGDGGDGADVAVDGFADEGGRVDEDAGGPVLAQVGVEAEPDVVLDEPV
ncbi:MAG: hypothetical protein RL223_2070, partial [Pseudomonadota bacterium]